MTGHIYIVTVLQSCTDPLHIPTSSSCETFPTPSDCTYGVGNTEVEENVEVIEECLIAVNQQADTGIKQEEVPGDITFPDIKAEPDDVSYVFMSIFLSH
jgi:hypothetical protein